MVTISGNLITTYKIAVISVKIKDQILPAFIDTGMYYGGIRQDIVYALQKVPDSYHSVFSAIDGPVRKPLYKIDFSIEDNTFSDEFMYLEWFTHPIVIGTKFLSQHKLNYDRIGNCFELTL